MDIIGTIIGFMVLAGAIATLYFLVIKPKMDEKEAVTTVAPSKSEQLKVLREEKGSYLGAGNPMGNGPRPLWKFKLPGSYYGNNIEVWTGNETSLKKLFVVPSGTVRTDGPGYALWKPISDEIPKNLVIHGSGGSLDTKCVIKY